MFSYITKLFSGKRPSHQVARTHSPRRQPAFRATRLRVEVLEERISPSALDVGIYLMPVPQAHRLIRSTAHTSGHVTNGPVVAHKLW